MSQLINKYRKQLLDDGYLIPKEQEEKHCKEHNLILKRLENGAVLLAGQSLSDDRYSCKINVDFNTGANYDPKNKEGIHHLYEHLFFSPEFKKIANDNLVKTNGSTSVLNTKFYISGTYNVDFKKFGIEPVIDKFYQSLIYPDNLKDTSKIQTEKKTIKHEIDMYRGDFDYNSILEFKKCVLEKSNIHLNEVIGDYKSVDSITKDDLEEIKNTYFGTNNMFVSVHNYGDKNEYKVLAERMSKLLGEFPRKGTKTPEEEKSWYAVKKQSGTNYKRKIHINNNLVYTLVSWNLDVEAYTKMDYGLNLFNDLLRDELFIEGRIQGISYKHFSQTIQYFPNKQIFLTGIVTNKKEYESQQNKLLDIVKKVQLNIKNDKSKIKDLLDFEKERQKAQPIKTSSKINNSIKNLKKYGHIINFDYSRQKIRELKPADLYKINQMIMETKPNIVNVGDL